MMNEEMKEFAFEVQKKLREFTDIPTEIQEYEKNNMTLTSIIFKIGSCCPVIPIDSFKRYPSSEAAQKIFNLFEGIKDCHETSMITDCLSDYDNAKDKLTLHMYSLNNIRYLKDKVYYKFGDMAAVLKIEQEDDGRISSMSLNEDILHYWGINNNEAYEQAIKNIKKNVVVEDIFSHYRRIMPVFVSDMFQSETQNCPLQIITNTTFLHGANQILNTELLSQIGEIIGDFVVYPSSVHEILIRSLESFEENETLSSIVDLVKIINATSVVPSDRLVDNAYYFNSKKKELQYIDTFEPLILSF